MDGDLDALFHRAMTRVLAWVGSFLGYSGFKLGDDVAGKGVVTSGSSHVDVTRPFSVDVAEGIITKVVIRSKTAGRGGSNIDWQSIYWLFPEGRYVALKGFSLGKADNYLGGDLAITLFQASGQPQDVHEPTWEAPWWLHQVGDGAFAATHQFADTPLTIGYGNNPFNASTPGSYDLRRP